MRVGMARIYFPILVMACICHSLPMSGEPKETSAETTFHVKPNIDELHQVQLDGVTCQFTFRVANAAHGEEWKLKLTKEGPHYQCVITDEDREPPHATFYGFSVHMFGAKDERLVSYDIWDHEGALLEGDDFIVEGVTLRSDSHWRLNGLSKIVLKCE